jgi:phage FluMu protein Com
MPIEFRCTQCNRLLRTPDESAGRQAACPECGALLTVPSPAGASPRAPGPAPAAPSEEPNPFAASVPLPGAAPGPGLGPPANPFEGPATPPEYGPPSRQTDGRAVASLVLGILSIVGSCCCPFVGLPLAIIGLTLGILARNSENRGMAIAGVVLSALGTVLGIAGAVLVVMWALA